MKDKSKNCEWQRVENNYFRCVHCKIVLEKPVERVCQARDGVQGLGDVVHKVAQAVGIEQTGGCGCGKTQETLNKLDLFFLSVVATVLCIAPRYSPCLIFLAGRATLGCLRCQLLSSA